jgi:hypothetical protein
VEWLIERFRGAGDRRAFVQEARSVTKGDVVATVHQ